MPYLDVLIGIAIGIVFLLLSALLFRIRQKWFLKLILNIVLGFALVFALNVTGVYPIPFNALTGVLVSFLGLFGVVLIAIIQLL